MTKALYILYRKDFVPHHEFMQPMNNQDHIHLKGLLILDELFKYHHQPFCNLTYHTGFVIECENERTDRAMANIFKYTFFKACF
jgi:hypothetical protein